MVCSVVFNCHVQSQDSLNQQCPRQATFGETSPCPAIALPHYELNGTNHHLCIVIILFYFILFYFILFYFILF